jgi:hypothetical protein
MAMKLTEYVIFSKLHQILKDILKECLMYMPFKEHTCS